MNSSEDNHTVPVFTSKLTPTADNWVGIILLTIVLLSVVGNGLVLLISYCHRSNMVGSEMLYVNLALADLFCCILIYPLSISSSFHHAWLGGSTSCTYYGFGCYVFGLCSILTITTICGLRYLKIRYCSAYAVWIKGARIKIACCFIWLVAVVWSSFPLLGWGEYVPEPYGLSCTVAWRGYHTSAKDAFYVVCSFSLFTLIPFLLIVVSQCHIIFTMSRLSRQVFEGRIRNKLKRTEKQLSWMFFCVSLGFVFAWFPYTSVSFLLFFNEEHQYMAPGVFVFPAIFAKISHIYNPFIYFYFNKNFRKEFCQLFCNFWVRQEETRVDTGERERNPRPIDIQFQDRSRAQKKESVSQNKSKGRNGSEDRAEEGSDGHQGIKPVRTWFPLDNNTRVVSEQVSTSV